LPEYLTETGNQLLRKRYEQLAFYHEAISDRVLNSTVGHYNKFALSDIGDWITREEYGHLLHIIGKQSAEKGRMLLRYIHYAHPVPESLRGIIQSDLQTGYELESIDRYPFYSLIPMYINK
jgi:S-adenosylmethionine:diacylglycerol 3-amino-3-carboxypropyl transferase